ncbi:D-alanyl-D-alanine carboxypeptidase/D-alanyl-D-alanine endopeptidase [Gallionella capsiferriformans]|uniref:D-alanyl-D-alanine carboxypeptidase/D-alanyl-D-alanine-endopeptidase n=1 Tax=Gallionella capsiferriformans (strain ES-2) TaxID=395494 RepID=D9SCQ4_GALCS|nr:D-alanyl-D-alanine carboxypeptidase/D-alanyl-D-alanine-endopeptidase [Gallionella capsiferriformans]ADL56635.1 D-alanyl-D-alanine carboxypeptidase/D-alanyl-D-alanine-endopeptidase [Gallionella capsiferriformans ES-2]
MNYLFALLTLFAALNATATHLPPAVLRELKSAGIPLSATSITVRKIGAPKAAISINAEQPMNPASTMKLLTTFAGLELLGPAYTWKTEAYLDGKLENGVLQGDLILKGYGDPKFTIEQFWLWMAELRARGLREIRGNLVIDRSFFDLPQLDSGAFDNDPVRAYNVTPDALLLNFNTLRLRYIPEGNRLRVIIEPMLEGVRLDSQLAPQAGSCEDWDDTIRVQANDERLLLQGGYPAECGEREHSLSVLSHSRYVDAVFRAAWHQLGGSLTGRQRDGLLSSSAQLFSTHRSEPMSLAIRDINKYSNNVMARQLFLTLGTTTSASIPGSTAAMRSWLTKKGLNFPELVLENGAGLSRVERISAEHMAQLLQSITESPYSAELIASLPILGIDGSVKKRLKNSPAASHAHLKTGTLDGVKTLAGFVQAHSGKQWSVVFFINHPNAKRGQAAQDALIEWLQGQ